VIEFVLDNFCNYPLDLLLIVIFKYDSKTTHLGWPSGIGLGLGSVPLLKVSGSILSGVNLGGLI